MNSKSIMLVLFLAFVSIVYSSCSNDSIIRNQLTGGIWNVEQFELREFSNNDLLSEQIYFDYGEYTFFDDGTGEFFDYAGGFFQDFVWNTDGFELVIVINNQPIVYEVLQNGADLQVWRTYIDYGPDDYDEIVMRLFRF
ncbi:MAG: hypothetical protein ACPG49_07180 [Chitinophagales bacterium]